ncbi:hypothetical protein ACT8ZV_05040 [Nocardioides sp. MAHUQ-72]|uniref:hypothetical protein n=1 Tax=unclassified Nocardioides TaxID=2615069 RepID=UPI0036090B4C
MNAYRALWNTVAGLLVALGLSLAVHRIGLADILAIAVPLAGIAGLYAYLYAPEGGGGPGHVIRWSLRIGVGAPAVVGLLGPLGPGALIPLGGFLALSPTAVTWFNQRYGGRGPSWRARPSFAARISDRDLALAWQSSYAALQTTTDVATKARIVQVRTLLLDELERRSAPDGRARRWVASPDQLYAPRRP